MSPAGAARSDPRTSPPALPPPTAFLPDSSPNVEGLCVAEGPCMAAGTGMAGPEEAFQYYRARYYDPKIGRFISEDPIGFAGGVNFYAYVRGNPVSLVDPFGLVDLNLFVRADDRVAYDAAESEASPPGVFTVAGHGSRDDVFGPWPFPMTIADLVKKIREKGHVRGQKVRLMVCSVGASDFAERLARELESPVEATTGPVNWQRSKAVVVTRKDGTKYIKAVIPPAEVPVPYVERPWPPSSAMVK